jgi:coenzyme F420-reducing hydrogenase delta subunit
MAELVCPDVIVYACCNSAPDGARIPRQWKQGGAHVLVREVACSGKIDAQYMFHALEGGVCGVCVVTCPEGECKLAQGNYRAEVRIRTVQRLLSEIGVEPERVHLARCSVGDSPDRFEQRVRGAVRRILALPRCSVRADAHETSGPSQIT